MDTIMPGPLIIALGNPLRGDDGVAWHVAEALAQRGLPPGTTLLTSHQLLPEMSDEASQAVQVIFIDASMAHLPGEVSVSTINPSVAAGSQGSHELDPPGLLSLADRLFGHAPPATLVAVGGRQFQHSETLSAETTSAIPAAVLRVIALLDGT